jgi:hypothetical protein
MSYEQASAIVTEGLRRGTRRHRSVALGVAAQFEFTLRQIDVIGEWQRLDKLKELAPGAVVRGEQVWRLGLRFEQLAEGTLDLTTSKNETAAVFDVTAYPLFTRALQLVPEAERRGPLVVDEDGPQSDADTTRISTAILPMPLVCRGQSGTCLHAMAV